MPATTNLPHNNPKGQSWPVIELGSMPRHLCQPGELNQLIGSMQSHIEQQLNYLEAVSVDTVINHIYAVVDTLAVVSIWLRQDSDQARAALEKMDYLPDTLNLAMLAGQNGLDRYEIIVKDFGGIEPPGLPELVKQLSADSFSILQEWLWLSRGRGT